MKIDFCLGITLAAAIALLGSDTGADDTGLQEKVRRFRRSHEHAIISD